MPPEESKILEGGQNATEHMAVPVLLRLAPKALQVSEDSNDVSWGYGPEVEKVFWHYILLSFSILVPLAGPGYLCLCELLRIS